MVSPRLTDHRDEDQPREAPQSARGCTRSSTVAECPEIKIGSSQGRVQGSITTASALSARKASSAQVGVGSRPALRPEGVAGRGSEATIGACASAGRRPSRSSTLPAPADHPADAGGCQDDIELLEVPVEVDQWMQKSSRNRVFANCASRLKDKLAAARENLHSGGDGSGSRPTAWITFSE